MAPRAAVPLREIVYTLSPYNQEIVMQGVAKLPGKIAKFFANVSSRTCRFSTGCRLQAAGTPNDPPPPYCLLLCWRAAERLGPGYLQRGAVWPHPVSAVAGGGAPVAAPCATWQAAGVPPLLLPVARQLSADLHNRG